MTGDARPAAWRVLWRRLRWPAALLVCYLLVERIFVALGADEGLFFPALSGSGTGLALVALGLAALVLRLLAVLVLPALLTYELALLVGGTVALALRRGCAKMLALRARSR